MKKMKKRDHQEEKRGRRRGWAGRRGRDYGFRCSGTSGFQMRKKIKIRERTDKRWRRVRDRVCVSVCVYTTNKTGY